MTLMEKAKIEVAKARAEEPELWAAIDKLRSQGINVVKLFNDAVEVAKANRRSSL